MKINVERLKRYAKDLRIVQSQVKEWNKNNDHRAHGQAVLLGAVAQELEALTALEPYLVKDNPNQAR